MSGAAESYYGPRYDSYLLRSPEWLSRKRALRKLHSMYLEDIEEGTLDDILPMSFPEFIQTEMELVRTERDTETERKIK